MNALKDKLREFMDSTMEWLSNQEWFQQAKAKWEELDPQSRMYLQITGLAGAVLSVGFVILSFMWSVHATYSDLKDKQEILTMLQSANEELSTLRQATGPTSLTNAAAAASSAAGAKDGPATENSWSSYFESVAATSGISKTNLNVSDPKAGTTSDTSKESLYTVAAKKINLRQAIRYAQSLETGQRPVKLRNLQIDTQPDASGYLDVTYSLSAFALIPKP